MARSENSQIVTVRAWWLRETHAALLVTQGTAQQSVWIPRSLCEHISKAQENDRVRVTIALPLWKAEEAGLDYE